VNSAISSTISSNPASAATGNLFSVGNPASRTAGSFAATYNGLVSSSTSGSERPVADADDNESSTKSSGLSQANGGKGKELTKKNAAGAASAAVLPQISAATPQPAPAQAASSASLANLLLAGNTELAENDSAPDSSSQVTAPGNSALSTALQRTQNDSSQIGLNTAATGSQSNDLVQIRNPTQNANPGDANSLVLAAPTFSLILTANSSTSPASSDDASAGLASTSLDDDGASAAESSQMFGAQDMESTTLGLKTLLDPPSASSLANDTPGSNLTTSGDSAANISAAVQKQAATQMIPSPLATSETAPQTLPALLSGAASSLNENTASGTGGRSSEPNIGRLPSGKAALPQTELNAAVLKSANSASTSPAPLLPWQATLHSSNVLPSFSSSPVTGAQFTAAENSPGSQSSNADGSNQNSSASKPSQSEASSSKSSPSATSNGSSTAANANTSDPSSPNNSNVNNSSLATSPLAVSKIVASPAAATASGTTSLVSPPNDGTTDPTNTKTASANLPGTTGSDSNRPLPPDTATASMGPVQIAQMASRAAQSEMRVGLNTSAFGSVEVRTVVHASDVGLMIGSEKGDLHSLLVNEIPAIASSLQQQNLRLSQVNFHQSFPSSGDPSSGGGGRPRYFTPQPPPVLTASPETTADNSDSVSHEVTTHYRSNLSILA
jgi:hypothetical protein